MSLYNMLLTLFAVIWVAIGTVYLKNGNLIGAVFYGTTFLFWMRILKDSRLVAIATVYSILSILVDFGIGVLIYKEVPSTREIVGFVLAIITILVTGVQ